MGGVMRRDGLRFGLLGPPVLYRADGSDGSPTGHGSGGSDGSDTAELPARSGTGAACGSGRPAPSGYETVRSPKVRALLAALLLEAGRTVPVDSLKEALWGGAPPASAQASLHNHVTRLRRLLDDPGRLRAVGSGYRLRVAQGELDVHVFERHVAAARGAHAARNWERVLRECAAALALWRGAPLSGLPAELGGYAFVRRLREARLLLLEWRHDAELTLGDGRFEHRLPELTALAAEHPLRESFHRQLMLALHRTGRQAEALAVHRDLRTRLVEELGVEPGPAVREAHVEVLGPTTDALAASPASAAPAAPSSPVSSTVVAAASVPPSAAAVAGERESGVRRPERHPRPAQLPPAPAHFTGRIDLLRRLRRVLANDPAGSSGPDESSGHGRGEGQDDGLSEGLGAGPGEGPRDGRGPAVVVLSGTAGVGKSALALQVAHTLRERFPDGQLYLHLHGATPGMTPVTTGHALTALLRDLGVAPRHIPEHPDAAAALLRTVLAPTRTLVVLDDAATAAQVRPLLPAGAGCAVIVTSRSPLTALDGADRFPLVPLSGEDSAALLRTAAGPGEGRDGLSADHPLVGLTGRLPLALRVVAARLAARSALTPDALARQLSEAESRLTHLEYDDLSVRRSLGVAHDALAVSGREADRDAALALRRIGALDLPAYGVPLLARLIDADESRAEAALDRLVDVALLEERAYGRYTPHDLVRDFARELAAAGTATQSTAGTATHSTADTSTHTATHSAADGAAPPTPSAASPVSPTARPHAEAPASVPVPASARTVALHWYAAVAERALVAVVEAGLDLEDRRRPTATQPVAHAAYLAQARPFAGPEEALGWADEELENIVALVESGAGGEAEGTGTAALVSTLLRLLLPCLQRRGRVAEMEVLGRAALKVARRLADPAAEAYALGDLAGLRFLTGRRNDALDLNGRALDIWRRLGRLSWIRRCLNNRGLLLEALGRYEESEAALRQSLRLSRRLGDPHGEAVTHSHLGNLYEHTDPRAAIEQHRRSLAIGAGIGAVIVQHSAHCNIGYAHLALGEPAAALPHFETSLRMLDGHGDWHGESQTRLGLVRALRALGRAERALGECAELLRRAEVRADRYTTGLVRHQHGLLLREQGHRERAVEEWRSALDALDGTDARAVTGELRELLAGRG